MPFASLALAFALVTPSVLPPDVVAINRSSFKIPIRIDPARRGEMRELILAVSSDQGLTWRQEASATPDQEAFSFFAPQDGQYWFSVVVVDQQGNRQPADLKTAPPGQKIVVDTMKPAVQIVSADRLQDELVVAWEARDELLDAASVRLEYRSADAPEFTAWTPVPISQPTGQTRVRVSVPGRVLVRLAAQDLAGNQATVQRDVPGGGLVSSPPAHSSGEPTSFHPAPVPAPPVSSAIGPSSGPMPAPAGGTPFDSSPAPNAVVNYSPAGNPGTVAPGRPVDAPRYAAVEPNRVLAASGGVPENEAVTPAPGADQPASNVLPPIVATNRKQIALDYEVIRDGPSKIGAVELWVTQDNGQSWRFLCDDPDLTPPIIAELPGEGQYGFRLVLKSGAGLSSGPPQPGQLPEMRVEVDLKPPEARLYEPRPDPARRDALIIQWSAADRNLAPNPITLEWAEHKNGPWHAIGGPELPNLGRHSWELQPGVPHRVYLRLIARDLAGNLSEAVTREPILIDLHKPEGRLKGLALSPRQP